VVDHSVDGDEWQLQKSDITHESRAECVYWKLIIIGPPSLYHSEIADTVRKHVSNCTGGNMKQVGKNWLGYFSQASDKPESSPPAGYLYLKLRDKISSAADTSMNVMPDKILKK